MEEKFFYCDSCGNLALLLIASGVVPECCGEEMTMLEAKSADDGHEKHVPVVQRLSANKISISIGSTPHPMTATHLIEFVCLQTTNGFVMRHLSAGDKPEVEMRFTGRPIAVYAYCNIHGLWHTNIKDMFADKPEEFHEIMTC